MVGCAIQETPLCGAWSATRQCRRVDLELMIHCIWKWRTRVASEKPLQSGAGTGLLFEGRREEQVTPRRPVLVTRKSQSASSDGRIAGIAPLPRFSSLDAVYSSTVRRDAGSAG
jgi:hypothetical protein